jgi:hypothetical protein
MKTIYLQKSLSMNGRNCLRGRKLFDHYKHKSDDILLGHIIVDNEFYDNAKDERFKRDLISDKILNDFSPDIIYIEGGMFASKEMWKIPEKTGFDLLNKGLIIIINDTDINDFQKYTDAYKNVFNFAKSYITFRDDNYRNPVYGGESGGSPAELVCFPDKMIISDWLKPVYSDVENVIVSWPLKLASWESLIISGNKGTTGTLSSDRWIDELDCCPFDSVAQIGSGFVVFIAGITTYWSEENEGNLKYLLNIGEFLYNESKSNRKRLTSHYHSNHSLFLSHRSVDKHIVSEVAEIIKREGIGIWFDKEKLLPSDSLTKKISEGLSEMSHFVLFWSKACKESNWVDRELNSAISQLIENKKPIIVVRLDDTSVPTIISDIYRIEAAELSNIEIGKAISDTIVRLEKRKS